MVSFDDLIPQEPAQRPLTSGEQKKRDADEYMKSLKAGIVGAGNAITFNTIDEIAAGLRAAPALVTSDKDFFTEYDKNLPLTRENVKQTEAAAPNAYLGGQVVGAIGSGVASVGTKGGAALANSLRTGGLGMRIGKAGALGAATSGAAGFGAGEGLENRLESSRDSALAGGFVGGAIPAVGAVAGKVGKAFQRLPQAATADDIKLMANAAYKKADESGGVLKGWFTNRFLDDIADIQPATIAGKKVPTDPKLAEALDYIGSFKNTRLTLQDAQNLDEYLGEAIDGFTELGQVSKSGKKLLDIQSRFRNAIENADDTLIEGGKAGFDSLKEGRALWSAQLKMRDIERIIQRAELTDNPATAIKAGFRNLLTNAKKSKGYTKDELKLMEKAAQTGLVTDLLKTGGSRLVPIIAGASGSGVLGTAAAGAGAAASRGMATRNAMVNAENVARAVSQRAVPQAATKGGLPAVISSRQAGQLAAPAGMVAGGQVEMPILPSAPIQAQPALDFNDLIPQTKTVIEPLSYNSEQPSLMGKIAQAESGGNSNAQNPLSSASGLYQFTDSTWRSAVNKWGRKYGITAADKANPQAQEAMAQELTKDNARILQAKGVEPTDGNLYFAHFMGAPAGASAIKMLGTGAIAARSFPSAAKSNPTIFFNKKGKPRTIDEVYQIITSKVV
jgi:hypothetical protein